MCLCAGVYVLCGPEWDGYADPASECRRHGPIAAARPRLSASLTRPVTVCARAGVYVTIEYASDHGAMILRTVHRGGVGPALVRHLALDKLRQPAGDGQGERVTESRLGVLFPPPPTCQLVLCSCLQLGRRT